MSDERPFLKKSFSTLVEDTLTHLSQGFGGRVILDDGTEGSVVRTLVEAFSRELAVCYEQLEAVYRAGYLDTASGAALDCVVGLLGVSRLDAGWLEGDVVFSRATPAPFEIEIPEGTLVSGRRVQAFETRAPAVLAAGQITVRVPVRSLEPKGDAVEPNKLSILSRPIAGIEQVTNPAALLPRRDPEGDDDLRKRARGAIRGGRTATISAIERAVHALSIEEVSVFEDPDRAGVVKVVIGDKDLTPAELEQARNAVEEVRPAGIRLDTFQAKSVWIRVRAGIHLVEDLAPQAKAQLSAELQKVVASFFKELGVNEAVRWSKLRNLLAAHPKVAEVSPPTRIDSASNSPSPIPTWPLRAVDDQGNELAKRSDGALWELGTEPAPVGIFIGSDERARLQSAGLDLQPPELLVWIDVEALVDPTADPAIVEQQLRTALIRIFPTETLSNTMNFTWDALIASYHLGNVANLRPQSLRLVILHDNDGRVVTLASSSDSAREDFFSSRERIEIRNIHVDRAPVSG